MTNPAPAAGWYPDPNGGPGQRYWDGTQWQAEGPGFSGAPQQAPYPITPYGGAQYGVDAYGNPLSDKSKLVAGLLQIFLSTFAVGRFYLGYTNIAIAQLAVSVLTCGIGSVWPLVDGIMILAGKVPDSEGRTLRE
ncbi:NINE protein [Mycobacterium sp. Marseille-P9652]|uniref:NINE protein n=1 Tax=Mycobacterium sp. Marseille-P9652 TaxID=2654950 RepID=UPI0012E8A323|nr:NINE protein [Mycobacterium sp. Marseille-P9652]